ncbi:MAG: single-stranded DNA-binding protein [Candidatus Paceibacterota bacterium]|jgi:single-strand DNA-binding protein
MNLNKVFLIGNLTRDVVLKTTPSGQSVADFGLATNRVWMGANGQKQEEAEFHNIVVWGKMAELCNQYLAKGRMVFLEGRIRNRSWQDANNQKRYKTEIIAENIQFGPKSMRENTKLEMPPETEDAPHEELPVLEADTPEDKVDNEGINSEEIPF